MRRIAILLTVGALSVAGQNWPAFRGQMASGISDGMTVPVKWDAEKGTNVAWKTPIGGISVSSPVIWGDKVFLVTSISSDPKSEFRAGLYGDTEPAKDNSEHNWKVICLELKSGKVLWEQVAFKGAPKTKRHPKASAWWRGLAQRGCSPTT